MESGSEIVQLLIQLLNQPVRSEVRLKFQKTTMKETQTQTLFIVVSHEFVSDYCETFYSGLQLLQRNHRNHVLITAKYRNYLCGTLCHCEDILLQLLLLLFHINTIS